MPNCYTFPEIVSKPAALIDQIEKIKTEFAEVLEAYYGNDLKAVSIELWDVAHACETAQRMMQEHSVPVLQLHQQVIKKNEERGYYNTAGKSCPFCGSDSIDFNAFLASDGVHWLANAYCDKCKAGGPFAGSHDTYEDAMKAISDMWDRRV